MFKLDWFFGGMFFCWRVPNLLLPFWGSFPPQTKKKSKVNQVFHGQLLEIPDSNSHEAPGGWFRPWFQYGRIQSPSTTNELSKKKTLIVILRIWLSGLGWWFNYPRKRLFEREISTKSRLIKGNPQTKTTNQIVQLGSCKSPRAVACKFLETWPGVVRFSSCIVNHQLTINKIVVRFFKIHCGSEWLMKESLYLEWGSATITSIVCGFQ